MKDMLKDIVDKHASIRNDINIIGYNIQGKYILKVVFTKMYLHTSLDSKLSYMNMDTPTSYITRIRLLKKNYLMSSSMVIILLECLPY